MTPALKIYFLHDTLTNFTCISHEPIEVRDTNRTIDKSKFVVKLHTQLIERKLRLRSCITRLDTVLLISEYLTRA